MRTATPWGYIKQVFKLVAYADDVKPAISCMAEFELVDKACTLLERASGVKLHRNPDSGKVKFLALGRWRGTITQEDLPHQYMSDCLTIWTLLVWNSGPLSHKQEK